MQSIFDNIKCNCGEPLNKHTTFKVGGPAKYFFVPECKEEIIHIIEWCRDNSIKYMIMGNGSNVLFSDDGYDGAIIQIYSGMNEITLLDDGIYAQSGALLSKISNIARDNSFTGMEFASGIPGTLGGAVVMNAGAYGGEMKNIISYVDVLMEDGTVRKYSGEEMEFDYRHSVIDDKKIVLGAKISLQKGDINDINAEMNRLKEARCSKQPLEYPSAGSTFKRPEGYFAGKLIQDSGLRGYRVGGAMVSDKHCGFVVNYDNATSKDITTLISDVQRIVKDKFGVVLEPEVKIIL